MLVKVMKMVMTEVVMVNDDESKSVLVLTLSTKLTRLQVTLQLEEKLTHLGGKTSFIVQMETQTNCSFSKDPVSGATAFQESPPGINILGAPNFSDPSL